MHKIVIYKGRSRASLLSQDLNGLAEKELDRPAKARAVLTVRTVPALPLARRGRLRGNIVNKVLVECKNTLDCLIGKVFAVVELEILACEVTPIDIVENSAGHVENVHVEVDLHHVVGVGILLGLVELGNCLDLNHVAKANGIGTSPDHNLGGNAVLEGNLHLVTHLTIGGKNKVMEHIAKVHKLNTTIGDCRAKLILKPRLQGAITKHVRVVLTDLVGVEIVLRCLAAEVVHNKTVDKIDVHGHGKKRYKGFKTGRASTKHHFVDAYSRPTSFISFSISPLVA